MTRVLERHNRCRNTSESALAGEADKSLTTPCTPPETRKKQAEQAKQTRQPAVNSRSNFATAKSRARRVVEALLGNLCRLVSLNF